MNEVALLNIELILANNGALFGTLKTSILSTKIVLNPSVPQSSTLLIPPFKRKLETPPVLLNNTTSSSIVGTSPEDGNSCHVFPLSIEYSIVLLVVPVLLEVSVDKFIGPLAVTFK